MQTKRTIAIDDELYARIQREAFFEKREIREIINAILAEWIEAHPEKYRGDPAVPLQQAREITEREQIAAAMQQAGNHRQRAADLLGITRMAFHVKCKKYGLKFPRNAPGKPARKRKK